ncbi:MAG: hypothetical protein ACM3SS_19625 [Rhodospirillaceae bacterium]
MAKKDREPPIKYDRAAEPTAIAKAHADSPAVVRGRDAAINTALERIELGDTLTETAKRLKVDRKTLIGWLLREQPERYRDSQAYIASVCAAELLTDIENARDMLQLGKAKERARVVLWMLERRYPRLYGQTQAPVLAPPVQININLRTGTPIREAEGVTYDGR